MSRDPSASDDESDTEPQVAPSITHGDNDELFFEILGSAGGREVLAALTRELTPVSRITRQCSVSRATVYRHLDRLRDLNLIEERETIGDTGGRVMEVRLTAGTASVSFGTRIVELRFIPVDPVARFEWLLNALADAVAKRDGKPSGAGDEQKTDASVETE